MRTLILLSLCVLAINIGNAQPGTFQCSPENPISIKGGNPEVVDFIPPDPVKPPPPPSPPPGDRLIYWVHGLGGSPENWYIVGDVTGTFGQGVPGYPPRKVTSIFPDYNELAGLDEGGTHLHNRMVEMGTPHNSANGITDKTVNFVIGNSQGGLAPRVTNRFYAQNPSIEPEFGGLVSFGSPHQGARILNNVDIDGPNMAVEFATEACQAITAGPIAETVETSFILDFLTSSQEIQSIIDNACDETVGTVLPILFQDHTVGITNDYFVGSPYIEELNQFSVTMPMVSFWGSEEEPVLWRTISSFTDDHPTTFDPFESDFDGTLVDKANSAQQWYQSKVDEWAAYSAPGVTCDPPAWAWALGVLGGCTVSTILDNIQNPTGDEADEILMAYQLGLSWWQNANDGYKVIIGALEFEQQVTGGSCTCVLVNPVDGAMFTMPMPTVQDVADCNSNLPNTTCNWEDILSFVPIYKQSDGVVLEESAANLPGANAIEEMPGSNHLQMVNDSQTKAKLLALFNGDFGNYFFTETRP